MIVHPTAGRRPRRRDTPARWPADASCTFRRTLSTLRKVASVPEQCADGLPKSEPVLCAYDRTPAASASANSPAHFFSVVEPASSGAYQRATEISRQISDAAVRYLSPGRAWIDWSIPDTDDDGQFHRAMGTHLADFGPLQQDGKLHGSDSAPALRRLFCDRETNMPNRGTSLRGAGLLPQREPMAG